jgi:hypothetical protein
MNRSLGSAVGLVIAGYITFLVPAGFIMATGMLRGLKKSAEGRPT